MKLSLSIDLAPLRKAASDVIDHWYDKQLQHRMRLGHIYEAKLRAAERDPHVVTLIEGSSIGTPSHRLMGEAAERGLTLDEMRALVTRRARERDDEILRMDDDRRMAKAELAAATTVEQITNIQARHG